MFFTLQVTHVSTVRYDCLVDHNEIMAAMCPDTVFTLSARAHLARSARVQAVSRSAHADASFAGLEQRKEEKEALVHRAHSLVTSSERTVQTGVKGLVEEYLEKIYFLLNGPFISRMLQHRCGVYWNLSLTVSISSIDHKF